MKSLFLTLMFVIGMSFAANAGGCTDCWTYADGYESAGGDWQSGYDDCNKNLNPCAIALDEVIIKT